MIPSSLSTTSLFIRSETHVKHSQAYFMESSDSDRRGEEDRVEMGLIVGSTTAVIFTSGLAARCGRCHPGLSIICQREGEIKK